MRKLFSALLLVFPALLTQGQALPVKPDNWQTEFFSSPATVLPILTAAAIKHSAQIRAMEVEKSISEQDIKLAKKAILASVAVASTYAYGNLVGVGLADPSNPNQIRTSSSSRYSTGVTLGLPLERVVSRSNLIKKQQLAYEHAELARQEQENLMRQQIIQLYQNVLINKKLLTLQQEAYVTVQTNYRLSEKQFRQGQLLLPELTTVSSQLTASAIAQETARNQYETAFMLLEEVVGAKISSLITP
jgi:outer membrane protein TolC